MNTIQKCLLATYLPIMLLVLVMNGMYHDTKPVDYLKVIVSLSLLVVALSIPKKFTEQKTLAAAFFFMLLGDIFLVIPSTWNNMQIDLSPAGIASFMVAYLFVIAATQKNFKLGRVEVLTAIPILGAFLYVVTDLVPYIKGLMFIGVLVFGAVLCYMVWTAVSTVSRKYFIPQVACMMALAGCILFISDIAVAYELYYPLFAEHVPIWINNFVRGTFILGWTILAMVIGEEKLVN